MVKTLRDNEVTIRLRQWMDDEYGYRGRFTLLERESGIPAQRWKNVFYQRQFATPEMLEFVHKKSTDSYTWVTTGFKPPRKDGYPFYRPPTEHEQSTLTNRLIWVVKEFASARGAALFTYLEERWHSTVSADEWANVILEQAPATALMIEQICQIRPNLAAWITTGIALPQVDPTSETSIQEWQRTEKAAFEKLASSLRERTE